ncbi:uncharacterized protein A4U43_C01F7170 [Asparagus officinalis]|uniref:Auxin-responsive protein n=1 Tax=Asparagus officinalis TaxID=4686 RepID=A0A5P1FMQ8_ASPOF|nr:auxin-responsive protein IAA10-like [Asparagus officinalis]ONK79518.1 uncharacterized protein A4U43_C01F7170 [Asparagus officinalis]
MGKEFMGLSESSSAINNDDEREERDEDELELGLSLGSKKLTGCRRILTAKDFPAAVGSRASPLSSSSSVSSSEGAKQSQVVVGWPPIRAFRINSLVNQAKEISSDVETKKNDQNPSDDGERTNAKSQGNEASKVESARAARFVKVNMDGDRIGRKVDLSSHRSYETLASALEIMFHRPTVGLGASKASKLLGGSSDFALTYEDKDGDWMLVGDVPWGMFLDTVKRLRIMRTSDATGLAPRFQSPARGLLQS